MLADELRRNRNAKTFGKTSGKLNQAAIQSTVNI